MKKTTFIVLVFFIFIAVGVFFLGRHSKGDKYVTKIQIDTLVVFDTIRIVEPKLIRTKTVDTIYIVVNDTTRIRDTLYMALPREEKIYQDSLYKAQVSGYKPNLDWLEVYPRTEYITEKITQKKKNNRWGIGVMAGYGFGLNNNTVVTTPFLGVGISYHIFTW